MTDPRTSPAVCSFSGGKDSCLALWLARRQGYQVRTLLTMFEETGVRSRSHAISRPLMERQATALGCELIVRTATWKDYEAVFIATLRELHASGHRSAIFGDIDLQAHRDWEEKVCAAADMRAVLPLWQNDRLQLVDEVLAAGFRAVVVCTDSRYLDDSFCGRPYDARFVADLPADVDACGENGEFHTFVYNGPCFNEPVPVRVDGFDDYTAPAEYGGVRYRFARLAAA
ncbi:MAG TPA: diphthine--ammonia ligase [Povalibacter sp.]|uniref:Dph6-related ATP pyrophosphatase n=1 Tax=Povalibacter sp. TaxID=1962978 RepID=UPI002B78731E|nr:diphthine--ammonia ligase [Povalibacter sp.]HMN45966.1 diphthine--ammonia ligase [Povalibacter sp.]